jgi:hypothetical protein
MNIPINEENCELSTLYWIPKFQKNEYLDSYIPGSTTELRGPQSYCDKVNSRGNINQKHRIGAVMVSVLAPSAVDRGFELRSGQTKDNTIDMYCFSAKHAPLRRKSKCWLARNQNNVSEWSDMSTHGLLFQ